MLFFIWIVVTFVEAVIVGLTGVTVVTGGVAVDAAVVGTVVVTVAGKGVFTVVGISVAVTVVASVVVVALGVACCAVHPLAATRSITSMNKPKDVFMK
jgi:hypothetical protein